jgi:peptidoglycan/xylan/chitin deacetylase (PgdA/CDA1 family)
VRPVSWPQTLRNGAQKLLSVQLHRKVVYFRGVRAVVSFTFDDFPRSAYRVAGALLKSFNARGTYYASLRRMNTKSGSGGFFTEQDLHDLVADGHELACHTFSHLHCISTPLPTFIDDVNQNQVAISKVLPGYTFRHFAYPFGEVTLAAKRIMSEHFASCRGSEYFASCRRIAGGINAKRLDLNFLRANRLYSSIVGLSTIERLIQENARQKGWLIFYTHDVCDEPSPCGCTPQYFQAALDCAVRSGAEILPIGQALAFC